ncbi:hypothetical protein [Aliiglaciecola litoralis]|uniref:Uncharacterized protein n=1 Tax=Aliiglaciecola litoralis TaxID=582857 RepID=A0ABN1LRE6_9ALTE
MENVFVKVMQIMLLGMFYSPAIFGAWLIAEKVTIVIQSETLSASISHCEKRAKASNNRILGGWVPIAKTQSGVEIEGTFSVKNQWWCQWQVTDNVSVLKTGERATEHHIVNFWQFFFLPVLVSSIGGLVVYLGIRNFVKNRKKETD